MASDYLTLGRGEVWFAPFAPGTRIPTGYKFFGNCPGFNLNVSVEELTHMDSTRGLREEDEAVITSRMLGGTIQCDDLKPANLGRFFLGSTATVTQATQTAVTETVTAEIGSSYQLGVSDAAPTGLRNLTITSVGTLAAGDDYVVDTERGILTFVEGGAAVDGTDYEVTFDAGAATYDQVISGRTEAQGALMFISHNANGKDRDYRMPFAKLRPDGDLALIGEEWTSFSFTVKGLALPNRAILYGDGLPVV